MGLSRTPSTAATGYCQRRIASCWRPAIVRVLLLLALVLATEAVWVAPAPAQIPKRAVKAREKQKRKRKAPQETDAAYALPRPYESTFRQPWREVQTLSQYIRMPDGVQLAADIHLPAGRQPHQTFPTLLWQTRSWRSLDRRWFRWFKPQQLNTPEAELLKKFVLQGYAVVVVDVRGTGASEGRSGHPWNPQEVQDGNDLVDWTIRQTWCNQFIGLLGVGYSGALAQRLAAMGHPNVQAAGVLFAPFDSYRELARPGGLYSNHFLQDWDHYVQQLDANRKPRGLLPAGYRGVNPVPGDKRRRKLREIVRNRPAPFQAAPMGQALEFRDDLYSLADTFLTASMVSPSRDLWRLDSLQVPLYQYAGWWDGALALGALQRHQRLSHPYRKLLIGPWDHGGQHLIDPYGPREESSFNAFSELLKFFDYHLRGEDNGLYREAPIHYYAMGEGRWRATPTWPPTDRTYQTKPWYLSLHNRMRVAEPIFAGQDTYQVDLQTTSGQHTRWSSQLGGMDKPKQYYPLYNRLKKRSKKRDEKRLLYQSKPLPDSLRLVGQATINLWLESDTTDAALFVYLEEVDPNGNVRYITEGQFRAIHRRLEQPEISDSLPPSHSYTARDAQELPPGQPVELRFALLPTAYTVPANHRLRLVITGADNENFAKLFPTGPEYVVHHGPPFLSRLELPVVSRRQSQPDNQRSLPAIPTE